MFEKFLAFREVEHVRILALLEIREIAVLAFLFHECQSLGPPSNLLPGQDIAAP